MEMRFWPVRLYSCPRVSRRGITGSLPIQTTSPMTPRKNRGATPARVRGENEEVLTNARTAMVEKRAEIKPMREREKMRAGKNVTAQKSQNRKGSSADAE